MTEGCTLNKKSTILLLFTSKGFYGEQEQDNVCHRSMRHPQYDQVSRKVHNGWTAVKDLDYLSWAHSKPALNPHTIHILTILSKHRSRNIFSGLCLINGWICSAISKCHSYFTDPPLPNSQHMNTLYYYFETRVKHSTSHSYFPSLFFLIIYVA